MTAEIAQLRELLDRRKSDPEAAEAEIAQLQEGQAEGRFAGMAPLDLQRIIEGHEFLGIQQSLDLGFKDAEIARLNCATAKLKREIMSLKLQIKGLKVKS
jgi:hypothetical protein